MACSYNPGPESALELLPSSALSSAQVFKAYPKIAALENRTFHLLFKPDILTCYEQSFTERVVFDTSWTVRSHICRVPEDRHEAASTKIPALRNVTLKGVTTPRLFLIDSFGFIFRAYHARARSGAPPMRTSTGLSTEAVYIFHNMVRKLLSSYKPEYIAAIFESEEPTFRSESFAEYKANRAEMPPISAHKFGISAAR